MTKTKMDEELFDRLRASGLRKRAARLLSQTTDRRRQPGKAVQGTIDELKHIVSEIEDRASGGPAKRKAAARKAAATRRRKAAARSQAAKKGARTRARS